MPVYSSNGRYDRLGSTATPDGGAGLRGRKLMEVLLERDLSDRIIDEHGLKLTPSLFKKLIPGWSTSRNAEMRSFVYSYSPAHNHPWAPTPSSISLTNLPLFGKNGWCMEALAYPRAGDEIDGPMETEGTSKADALTSTLEVNEESVTAEEAECIAAIQALLSARQLETEAIDGEVSEDDEDSDYDNERTSSDSEARDPTYAPSNTSSLSCSISSLHPPPAASIETQYARLFNAIAAVMSTTFGMTRQDSPHPFSNPRWFSSSFATLPVPQDKFKRKPDGILIDGNRDTSRITWRKVMAILEYTEQEFTLSASITRQMHIKSYLILRRQPWRTFVLGVSLSKNDIRLHYYDRSGTIISDPINIQTSPKKLIDIIATLAYGDRARLGYDPTIYVNEDILDQQQPINPPTARSTLVVDQNPLPQRPPGGDAQIIIGWVIVPGGERLDILGIVWISDGMVGRGTACYHVRNPVTLQEYALKDYWVDATSVNHETEMLDKLKHVPGVPKVVHSWTVGKENDVGEKAEGLRGAQNTIDIRLNYRLKVPQPILKTMVKFRVHRRILMTPFASPIYAFSSLEELVWSALTITDTHEMMTDAGVLHQDMSINNLMIALDLIPPCSTTELTTVATSIAGKSVTPVPSERGQSRRGWIVDLDYAKLLNTRTTTSVGTGTLPFLSCRILSIIEHNSKSPDDPKIIDQTAEDDLESLFYVLVWICCLYEGPNNSPRRDRPFKQTFCYNWAERAFEQDFLFSKYAKSDFINLNQAGEDAMFEDLHPYFKPIFGLLRKWRRMIRDAYANGTQVSYPEVRQVLQQAYDQLCGEDELVIPDTYNTRRPKRRRTEEV